MGGELESREEAFGGMGKAILAAMLGVFAILVLQFKSYLQPLIIFSFVNAETILPRQSRVWRNNYHIF